jgi:hypothetical protein
MRRNPGDFAKPLSLRQAVQCLANLAINPSFAALIDRVLFGQFDAFNRRFDTARHVKPF